MTTFLIILLALVACVYAFVKVTNTLHERKRRKLILAELGFDIKAISRLSASYRTVKISKKTGGMRTLQIPSDDLKAFQKSIALSLGPKFNCHWVAHGFRPNRSIVTNAKPHSTAGVIIKLDIKNFFDDIKLKQITKLLKTVLSDTPVTANEREKIAALLHSDRGLPQGSPASPIIANAVLYQFDRELTMRVRRLGGRYTRYADDITISFETPSHKIVRKAIGTTEYLLSKHGFKMNKKRSKVRVIRAHRRQEICGVTVNSGNTTISRHKRRQLRAIQHRLSQGKEASLTASQADGLSAHYEFVMRGGQKKSCE